MHCYLSGNDGDLDNLQHEFPWFASSGVILLTRVHEVVLDLAPELLLLLDLHLKTRVVLRGRGVVLQGRGVVLRGGGVVHLVHVTGLLHV